MADRPILDVIRQEIAAEPLYKTLANEGQMFVAWYIARILGQDPVTAVDAVTDGPGDKQIDAVLVDYDNSRVVVVQGKYYRGHDLSGEAVRECLAALHQLKDLSALQDAANDALKRKILGIKKALDDGFGIGIELVTSAQIRQNAREDAFAFQRTLCEKDGFDVEITLVDGRTLWDRYQEATKQTIPQIDHVFDLADAQEMEFTVNSTRGLLVVLPLTEAVKISGIDNQLLFRKNVRQALSKGTKVNLGLRETLGSQDAADFFFYHNGITAICNSFSLDKGKRALSVKGINVVNGCQSLTTLLMNSAKLDKHAEARILFRFYEIKDHTRADRISTYTNSQNKVSSRDLASNDPIQLLIKKRIQGIRPDICFTTKRGESVPRGKKQFDSALFAKLAMSWGACQPHLSYSEERLYDRYYSRLFTTDVDPNDAVALFDVYTRLMGVWGTPTLSLRHELSAKRYHVPFHIIAAIATAVAVASGAEGKVPRASVLNEKPLADSVDRLITIAAGSLQQAFEDDNEKAQRNKEVFSIDNWMKIRQSVDATRQKVKATLTALRVVDANALAALRVAPERLVSPELRDE